VQTLNLLGVGERSGRVIVTISNTKGLDRRQEPLVIIAEGGLFIALDLRGSLWEAKKDPKTGDPVGRQR
jgi:hypothetical protein